MGNILGNMSMNPQGMGMNMNGTPNNMSFWGQQQQQQMVPSNFLPHYEVIEVNGENGANAFQMGPNSSIILADKSAPIVWLVKTDGAGYKTATPFDVFPHKAAPQVDLNNLEARLSQLEEIVNAKQSAFNAAKSKKQPKPVTTTTNEQPTISVD